MIAEGLVPYLTEKDVHRLLTGVVDAFPTGQIQIDTVPVWAWRTSKWDPTLRKYDARFHCGFDVPAALAAWHPRLEYVDEAPMYDAPILRAKAPRAHPLSVPRDEPGAGHETVHPHRALPLPGDAGLAQALNTGGAPWSGR
ncbi:hypothetical protein ACFSTC_27830 [Nonomuraea ferruginea]